jgi:hypothetical protein
MNDAQLISVALASAPTMIAVLIGILVNNSRLTDLNSRIGDINGRIGDLRTHVDMRFGEVDRRMDEMRNDLKETWRAELRRVEEVLDARLKHIEDR